MEAMGKGKGIWGGLLLCMWDIGTNLCVHNSTVNSECMYVNVCTLHGEDIMGGCPICWEVLKIVVVAGGRILGRKWDKSLKSFPPCYSQSPLLRPHSWT